jgi:hypothetical protein
MGTIPDGLYEFVENTLTVVSSWPTDRILKLVEALESARASTDPQGATEAVLAENKDIVGAVKGLTVPRNAGEFWAFVAVLLAVLMLVMGQRDDPTVTVNVDQVIEEISGQCPMPPDR